MFGVGRQENNALGLEEEYRQRQLSLFTAVKRKLDYQVDYESTERRLNHEHLVEWVTQQVTASVTAKAVSLRIVRMYAMSVQYMLYSTCCTVCVVQYMLYRCVVQYMLYSMCCRVHVVQMCCTVCVCTILIQCVFVQYMMYSTCCRVCVVQYVCVCTILVQVCSYNTCAMYVCTVFAITACTFILTY